jgi:3-oxoacyl-[acyl-carrier-protein] synthase I
MKNVCLIADNIVSPLGFTSEENFSNILAGKSGLQEVKLHFDDFTAWASFLNNEQLSVLSGLCNKQVDTRFEKLLYSSINSAVNQKGVDASSASTIFIFSTTKGNIELMVNPGVSPEKLNLYTSAQKVTTLFGNPNKPVVVSNACVSGVAALIIAHRMLKSGQYKQAIVCGADTVNEFVLSGFQSLKALSPDPCKPFDKNRKGINLGEAGATIVLQAVEDDSLNSNDIVLCGGSITNDANHISGPSRTGLELAMAINRTLSSSLVSPENIDFVSAHGTATDYNDEMEAKALNHAQVAHALTNSFKGYYGHTLGVAGLLESILSVHSMRTNTILPSRGYEECGTTMPVNICKQIIKKNITHCLKTTAGFGGCNAAILFSKK